MNRRVFLFGLPTAALSAFGYAKIIEPRWLEETRKTVVTGRNLRRPLRVAHIADFHASALIPISFLEEAFRRVLAMKPDLVCITGDFGTTDNDFDKPKYEAALQMLSSKVRTYAVMGNHDGGIWAAGAAVCKCCITTRLNWKSTACHCGWLAWAIGGRTNCGLRWRLKKSPMTARP